MKKIIQKLVSLGVDLSTRKAMKRGLRIIGIKPENIDKLYIELRNDIDKEKFNSIHPKHKLVFIPQCLRNSKKCRAELSSYGYVCKACSSDCKARIVKECSEKRGYRVFIVPGGSMVFKIMEELKPMAVMGIGCLKEITVASENIKIPSQGIELLKDGCVDTDVNMEDVLCVLSGNSKFSKKGE